MAQPSLINAMAIASLVLSISALPASVVGCGLLFPIFAGILGLISYAPAKMRQPAQHPARGAKWGNLGRLVDSSAGHPGSCVINLAKHMRLVRIVIHKKLPCFGYKPDAICVEFKRRDYLNF